MTAMDTIDALLGGFAGVEAGDRVLLMLPEADRVDARVVGALQAGIAARSAASVLVRVPPFNARIEAVPEPVATELLRADVALDLADHESLVHTEVGRRAVREGKLRLVGVSLWSLEELGSSFASYPLARLFARARIAAAHLDKGGRSRLSSPNGTDLTFDVVPGRVRGMPGGRAPAPLRKGEGGFGLFPPGAIGTSPETAEGTIVLDGLVGFRGVLAQPITLRVAGGFVREIAGGAEADWLRERFAAHDNGGFVAKILAGIHPAAPIEAGLRELDQRKARLSRGEGVTLFGFGDSRAVGGTVASSWHWDGVVMPPIDWSIEGRSVFAAGILQGPPEVIGVDEGRDLAPHSPRPIARAGELCALRVDCRGPMPHMHRNLESDEVWIPLAGGPFEVTLEGHDALPPLHVGHAALIPRGVAHRVSGSEHASPMLVIERLPPAPLPMPADPGRYVTQALDALADTMTSHWSRPARPLWATRSLRVEVYCRPEGMLRSYEALPAAELWIPLRGAITVDADGVLSEEATPGHVLSLPRGALTRVLSVRPDTLALRVVPA
jgi:mannose-6-phosphate isomerase-like protein (cupin superfamily)